MVVRLVSGSVGRPGLIRLSGYGPEDIALTPDMARYLRNQLTGVLSSYNGWLRNHDHPMRRIPSIDRLADGNLVGDYLRPRRHQLNQSTTPRQEKLR
jgi:hypothetical protein